MINAVIYNQISSKGFQLSFKWLIEIEIEIKISLMNKDIKDKYKITVVGDSGVGKSAILTRFTENTFNPHFTATIGI